MIRRVAVVVPAREEELLPRCLTSLDAAREAARRARPDVAVDVLVVLDGCRDGSAAVVAHHGERTISCDLGRVGAVRDLGARRLLTGVAATTPPEATWLACTDADSAVPRRWLLDQLAIADAGADLVVGTVEPVDHPDPAVVAAWGARHDLGEGHGHVHGANLGIRASTYLVLEGFAPLALDEDVDLVRRARARSGTRVTATDLTRVTTSGRRVSRCAGGFAGYLGALEEEVG